MVSNLVIFEEKLFFTWILKGKGGTELKDKYLTAA